MAETRASLLKTAKAWLDPRQVGYLIFFVTNRCNFRCDFCFYYAEIEKGRKPEELTLDEIEKITLSLGPLLQLSLTGGEPFLRKDLGQIYWLFARNCNARYVTIPTNASLTDRMEEFVHEVLPAYPDTYLRLTFSVDGIGEEHDNNRSMPGSYAKIVESYKRIAPLRARYPNLVLDANSVYTARSEATIRQTLANLAENFEFDNLSATFARGDIKDPALKTQSERLYVELNEFLEGLRRTKEGRFLYPLWRGVRDVSRENLIRTVFRDEFVTPCVAGRKLIVLSETGEVLPCEILGRSMGNVRAFDYDVPRLLAAPENEELRHWIVDEKCRCSFECALGANVVWNWSTYPRLLLSALRNIGRE